MMRERRQGGDVRTRSPPPIPRATIRDYKYSPPRREIRERYSRNVSSSSSVPREPDRSSRILRRDYDGQFYGDRDGQLQRLSQFNEGLSRGDSTSMKFQWKHLLAKPTKLNDNVNHTSKHSTNYGLSATRVSTERNYQGSGFSDVGRSGILIEKPMSVEMETARIYSSHPPDIGNSKSSGHPPDIGISKGSGHVDGGFLLPSRNVNIGLHKDDGLRFRDHLHMDKLPADKLSARELYHEEEKPMFNLRGTSHYMISSPRSKAIATATLGILKDDFPGSYNDNSHFCSDGFGRSSRMPSKPVARNGHGQTSHIKSPAEPDVQLDDVMKHRRPQLSPSEGKHRDYIYPEVRRSEKVDMSTLSDEFYGKMVSIPEDHGHRGSLRASIVDPIVNRIDVTESSRRAHLSESRLWHHHHSSQQPIPNYLNASGTSHSRNQDGEVLGHRSTHLDYEVYQDHESLPFGEDYGYGKNTGPRSLEARLDMLPMTEYDPSLYGIDGSPHKRLTAEELDFHEPSRKMLKRKLGVDKKMSRHNPRNKLSSIGRTARQIQDLGDADEQWTGEDMGPLFLSKKSRLSCTQYKKGGRTFDMMASHKIFSSDDQLSSDNLSLSMPSHLSKPYKSGGRDIKKRLRPGPLNVRISHPLVKKYKPNKFLRRTHDGFHGSLHVQGGDPTEHMVTPVRTEPPESSEDFKQLVHSAFYKFVKHLNEIPAQRGRFTEHGKAGSLKCSICGSDSEEFVDTESLVIHAYTSQKFGFRAQHLGFHKALCVLMGWKSAVAPYSSWVRQALPDAEALALKEDLIIWPPVVVIHNSSIGSNNPDERVIVSIEVLEAILREMGFGEKAKVCRGKPANQSIMVVKFNSTFSGLQEAKRLHKFYTKNKHGKAEFLQINSGSSGSSSGETRKASADKVENVLYGYLGIAEDMDKLDFETKKRCLVKSKKEIQEIAVAPLRTE